MFCFFHVVVLVIDIQIMLYQVVWFLFSHSNISCVYLFTQKTSHSEKTQLLQISSQKKIKNAPMKKKLRYYTRPNLKRK